jgi:hypothetical protein
LALAAEKTNNHPNATAIAPYLMKGNVNKAIQNASIVISMPHICTFIKIIMAKKQVGNGLICE